MSTCRFCGYCLNIISLQKNKTILPKKLCYKCGGERKSTVLDIANLENLLKSQLSICLLEFWRIPEVWEIFVRGRSCTGFEERVTRLCLTFLLITGYSYNHMLYAVDKLLKQNRSSYTTRK